MSGRLRLVIFDVDGTLIDSQDHIALAMAAAFGSEGLPLPGRAAIRDIVGLSLPVAIAALAPGQPDGRLSRMVAAYKDAFAGARATGQGLSPLYSGAAEALDRLVADPWTLLGIATGKSRRGLAHVLDLHGLHGRFQTLHCADDHPSKPHPAMIAACLGEAGVEPEQAVLVGDTTFDMQMAVAAGIAAIGVTWGYHAPDRLRSAGAACLIDDFAQLDAAIARTLAPTEDMAR